MKYRNGFARWVLKTAGGSGKIGAVGAGANASANLIWGATVAVGLVATALAINWTSSATAAQYILAAGWGLLLGMSMLFFFPPKLLITIFGGFVGTGVSDLVGAAQALGKVTEGIAKIVAVLNSSLSASVALGRTALS
jgi:hypothetical protein